MTRRRTGEEPNNPTSERHRQVERIFLGVLEHDSTRRLSFLQSECGDDEELRHAVSSLLLLHEQSGPLDRLGVEVASLSAEILRTDDGVQRSSRPHVDPGATLGRYEIRQRLGAGGMGEVFRAFDPRLQREVAVKVIARRIDDHEAALARFEREARAASALNHPNIVTVHDIDEQDGFPYIVMEFVEGESLADTEDLPLTVDRLLPIATQVAAGLAAAHARGVVHRDLKPANIVVDRHGTPRILDFGLAIFGVAEARERQAGSLGPGLPGVEGLAGTVGYIAPESVRGGGVDARSDQFAFGATLYELATGQRAFVRSTTAESLLAALHEDPEPLNSCAPELPSPLIDVIERCLHKDPQQRFADTEEIHQILSRLRLAAADQSRARATVPIPSNRLVGREAELATVSRMIVNPEVRLLTLTGPGGSGKTRLAVEVARDLQDAFMGGVWFVSLAGTTDPDLVLPTIAEAVAETPASGSEPIEHLRLLMGASANASLLVLDNLEQVVEAAPAIADFLEECPNVSVLATSRERLQLSVERGFAVEPLGLPGSGEVSPSELAQVPSIALFVDRAFAADPEFSLDADNAAVVAELCRRFDGLPLALELAAARVRLMTPELMLQRLGDRLELLKGGARDLPDRQRTLRAAMDWSYALLEPTDRTVFRRLAVFSDGFTLEAVEAVLDPFGILDQDVLEVVESLLNQSLLTRRATADNETRFSMLETVREYALQRMQEEENVAALRRAHTAYFLVLAEDIGAALGGEPNPCVLNQARRERANFSAALEWAIAEDEGEWGLRMARGLFEVWDLGEGILEGHRYMAQLLRLPSAERLTKLRADVSFRAGSIAHRLHDFPRNIEYQEEALALYQSLDNDWGQAVVLNAMGVAYTEMDDYGEARRCYERCMQLWHRLGENTSVAATISNFAYVARLQGELEEARALYRKAAKICKRVDDKIGAAWKVSHEADVAREQDDPRAEQLYLESLDTFRTLGEDWGVAAVLVELAQMAVDEGDLDTAAGHYRDGLTIFDRLGHQRGTARALEGLVLVAARHGLDERVVLLAAAAAGLRERAGQRPEESRWSDELDSAIAVARSRLGEAVAVKVWSEGRRTPIETLMREPPGRVQA